MKRLQDFSFHKSHYERTCQKKICGWSIFGKACQIGPDKDGNCQAQYECVPYKKGDRWLCTRPGNSGGKCDQGPTADGVCCNKTPKCIPIDSMRKRRGGLILSVLFLGVVALAFVISTPLRSMFIDPGELTTKHSLEGNQCVQCHVTDPETVGEWFGNAFTTVSVHQSNRKCLACHDLGFNNTSPHNLDPEKLSTITAEAPTEGSHALRLFTPDGLNELDKSKSKIACVSCHREHKGRDHDLTHMDNSQCSTCHVSSHKNFVSDHPEFTKYPHNRRQRIVFDHSAHIKDYFKKEKLKIFAPTTCASCHEVDGSGQYMQAKSFEEGCQSCHGKDVTGEKMEEKGFAVIRLPAIDLQTLSSNGKHVGQWPSGLEDEEMTGSLLFLLSSEKKLEPILKMIAEGKIELFDLSSSDENVLTHVQYLVWEIKRLLHDLSTGGHATLLKRIKLASDAKQNSVTAEAVGNIPLDMVLNAQQVWLPALNKEMELYADGKVSVTKGIETRSLKSTSVSNEDWSNSGAWYAQDYSLYYRPGKHADEFIRSWLEITKPGVETTPSQSAAFKQMSYDKLPGQCTKCHSIDKVAGVTKINWQGYRSNAEVHNFTDFNHKAHFSLLSEKGCATCHELNADAKFIEGYKDTNPATFQSGWNDIDKETCNSCHTPQSAGDDCTLCHNYHVGEFTVVLPASSMGKNIEATK